MSNTKIWVAVVVVAIIAAAGFFYPVPVVQNVKDTLGALVGPNIFDHLTLRQSFTKGGTVVATSSTAATFTLTTNELRKEVSYISWTPNVSTTLTTMASTSAPLTDLKSGESFEVYLHNASSTAAATITLAAGTGIDLQDNEDSADLAIAGLDVAKLTFIKKPNTDVMLIVDEFTEAD